MKHYYSDAERARMHAPVALDEYRVQRRYPPTELTPHPGWGEAGASSTTRGGRYKELAYAIRSAEMSLDEYRAFNRRNAQAGRLSMVRRIEYRVIDANKVVRWESSTDDEPTPSVTEEAAANDSETWGAAVGRI